ncbi:MAG: master DNA invertase Mpi family serine-type recombinase [Faecalicoccus sp.]|nr:master DNA invertase Mpi family serine-type recombinase [Faecalicoccus sp.]
MIYGYIRVSTDKQTVENQRFEITNFCATNDISIESWIEETISGTKKVDERKLGKLLKKLKYGDIIICSELSRLGRSMFMIMSILNYCMENGIKVWTIKDNYRLGDDLTSKVLAFAFGLSAEIERDLISRRTKEALAKRKKDGVKLGRPKGKKSNKVKLTGCDDKIRKLIKDGHSKTYIAKKLRVSRSTLYAYMRLKNIRDS